MTKKTKNVDTFERRTVEVRAERSGDGPTKLFGYAAVFDERTDMGFFKEEIAPGTFARALDEKQDVRALINHDPNFVLGRTTNGTLTLAEDDHGLRMEVTPPDTQAARDLMTLVERGDVSQCSFGFRVTRDGAEWTRDGDSEVRRVTDADIRDVSIVTFPQYKTTEVEARSVEQVFNEHVETNADHEAAEDENEPTAHLPDWVRARVNIVDQHLITKTKTRKEKKNEQQ